VCVSDRLVSAIEPDIKGLDVVRASTCGWVGVPAKDVGPDSGTDKTACG
jgi:hypothetical protein